MIFETNDKFPFDKLVVGKPTTIPGGSFLIRYSVDESPLYVQSPKCSIRQIQSKTGKKMFCDIIFQQENEQFIRWMETLENKSQRMIHARREEWFETPLELEEIEGSFVSPMKIYKAGKSYIVRTSVPVKNGQANMKIYDEDEKDVSIDSIQENTQVMVILEIQGIRCSSSSFQIEIEIKQMMVMKPDDLFNKFIFKKKPQEIVSLGKTEELVEENVHVEEKTEEKEIPREPEEVSQEVFQEDSQEVPEEIVLSNELCEVDFDLDEMPKEDAINIKDRKEMYYEMYREARQKAKVARDLALSAYLEAKRIKNTYMLEDILSSSSDEDSDEDSDEGIE
jgi:hypothetical protein